MGDDSVSTKQTVTMKSEMRQVKESIMPEKIIVPAKPKEILPSPATTEFHPATKPVRVIEAKASPPKQKEEPVVKKREPSPPRSPKTPKSSEGQVITVTTTKVTKVTKEEQPGEETDTMVELKGTMFKPEGISTLDWTQGRVRDRKTGEDVTVEEALRRGLIEIDWHKGTVRDSLSGKTLTAKDATREGLIDSHICHLIETRMKQLKSVAGPVTLNEAATKGLLIIPLGRIRNPATGQRMTVEEAIDTGFLDPNRSIIIDPATGERITLTDGIQRGIFNPHSGDVRNTATGQTMTLTEFTLEGLIPELGLKDKKAITLEEAIKKGYVNTKTGMFKNPTTGVIMEVDKAIEMGFLTVKEETVKVTKKKTKVIRQGIPLDVAFEKGLVDSKRGTFKDPNTGEVMSLAAAITYGYIRAPRRESSSDLGDVEGIDFEEALKDGLIDVKNNTFTEPITDVLMPLDAAIRKGFVTLPEGGVSVEVREQVEEQLTRSQEEHLTSTTTTSVRERSLSQERLEAQADGDDILEITKITETVSRLVPGEHGLPMSIATDQSLFNARTGRFSNQDTGRTISLEEAIRDKLLDPRSAQYTDPTTGTTLDLQECIESGIMDVYGNLTDTHTGARICYHDAVKKGMVVDVAILEEPKMKQTVTTETTKLVVHDVEHPVTKMGLKLQRAIDQGVIDVTAGIYRNPKTKDAVRLNVAYEEGLIRGEVIDVFKTKEEIITSVTKEQKLVTLTPDDTMVVEPGTNNFISMEEAKGKGIIDEESGLYIDPRTGKCYNYTSRIKQSN